jgi:hypothetical protein
MSLRKKAQGESLGSRIGLEMGSDETSNMGIEGKKIGITSR